MVRTRPKPSRPGISTSESSRSTGDARRPHPGHPVEAVHGGLDLVAGLLQDHPLELAHADGVLHDEHLGPGPRGAATARAGDATGGDPRRGGPRRRLGQLAQVEQADHAAVPVDGRAGHARHPAQEVAEVLDDDLALPLEPVHRPGQLTAGVAHDDGARGRPPPAAPSAAPRSSSGMLTPWRTTRALPATSCRSASRSETDSSTPATGTAYRSSPTRAIRQRSTPRVTGRVRVKVVPSPRVLRTSTKPPRSSTTDCTTSRPTPRPECSVTATDGGQLGREQQRQHGVGVRGGPVGQQPALHRDVADPRHVHAGAVVGHDDDDRGADGAGLDPDGGLARLAGREADLGGLAAVVDGVGDEVLERVGDRVEDLLVELGVLPGQPEHDLLAPGGGDVADEAGERGGDPADRHHRQAHAEVADLRDVAALHLHQLAQPPAGTAHLVGGPGEAVHGERDLLGQHGAGAGDRVAQHPGPAALLRELRGQLGDALLDPARAELGLPHHVEQLVDLAGGDPDRVHDGRGRPGHRLRSRGGAGRRRGHRRHRRALPRRTAGRGHGGEGGRAEAGPGREAGRRGGRSGRLRGGAGDAVAGGVGSAVPGCRRRRDRRRRRSRTRGGRGRAGRHLRRRRPGRPAPPRSRRGHRRGGAGRHRAATARSRRRRAAAGPPRRGAPAPGRRAAPRAGPPSGGPPAAPGPGRASGPSPSPCGRRGTATPPPAAGLWCPSRVSRPCCSEASRSSTSTRNVASSSGSSPQPPSPVAVLTPTPSTRRGPG